MKWKMAFGINISELFSFTFVNPESWGGAGGADTMLSFEVAHKVSLIDLHYALYHIKHIMDGKHNRIVNWN